MRASLLHVPSNTQWIAKPPELASPCVTAGAGGGDAKVEITSSDRPLDAVQRQDTLVVNLAVSAGVSRTVYRFQTFAESPAIIIDVTSSSGPTTEPTAEPPAKAYYPTGIEKPARRPRRPSDFPMISWKRLI